MKKTSKKLKIIIFVATILVVMILAIVIIENVIKENNLENKEYLETISNADSNLIASYIKEGVTIGGITGTLKMLDTSDATATEEDVLEGKTFYAGSNDIKTGTMTNNGDWSTTVADGESVTIPEGYHSGEGHVSVSEATGGAEITLVDSYSTTVESYLNYTKTISDNSKSVIVMVTGFGASQTQLPNPNISSGTMSISDFTYYDNSSNKRWQNVARVYTINNIQTPFTITIASTNWIWGWGVKFYTVK